MHLSPYQSLSLSYLPLTSIAPSVRYSISPAPAPPPRSTSASLTTTTGPVQSPRSPALPWQTALTSSPSQRAPSVVVPSRTSAFRPLAGAVAAAGSPNGGSPFIRRPAPGPLPAHIMRYSHVHYLMFLSVSPSFRASPSRLLFISNRATMVIVAVLKVLSPACPYRILRR